MYELIARTVQVGFPFLGEGIINYVNAVLGGVFRTYKMTNCTIICYFMRVPDSNENRKDIIARAALIDDPDKDRFKFGNQVGRSESKCV